MHPSQYFRSLVTRNRQPSDTMHGIFSADEEQLLLHAADLCLRHEAETYYGQPAMRRFPAMKG